MTNQLKLLRDDFFKKIDVLNNNIIEMVSSLKKKMNVDFKIIPDQNFRPRPMPFRTIDELKNFEAELNNRHIFEQMVNFFI